MLHFAYDGSIHGDWVARYAMRMATRLPEPRLQVLYVHDGQRSESVLKKGLARIESECASLSVPCELAVHPARGGVAATLLGLVPQRRDHYLVCGTRARHRGRGFLAGTVSQQLLREGRCQVLSLRVIQPGLLGGPRSFLVPVSGRPEGIQVGLPFLRLLAPESAHLEVLLVRRMSRQRFRGISHEDAAHVIERGESYVRGIERSLSSELHIPLGRLDAAVVLSDDLPKEIVIQANKAKSQIIYMGASAVSLRQRSVYGSPIEQVLRSASCDIAIYGTPS